MVQEIKTVLLKKKHQDVRNLSSSSRCSRFQLLSGIIALLLRSNSQDVGVRKPIYVSTVWVWIGQSAFWFHRY